MLSAIKYWYNGYSWDGKTSVYNPFSTLLFFDKKEFSGYWFETGTPTFLVEAVEKMGEIGSLIKEQKVSKDILKGPDNEEMEPISLLFQTGYLTVKKKEIKDNRTQYTIDFPNNEVKEAFLTRLMAVCERKSQKDIESIRDKVKESLKERDAEGVQKSLVELFANIAYDLITKKESYYHSLFLIAGVLSGYEVEPEVHTDDAVLKKGKEVIVVEIKYGKGSKVEQLLKEGMEQIKEANII